jgi:hypothetical protein
VSLSQLSRCYVTIGYVGGIIIIKWGLGVTRIGIIRTGHPSLSIIYLYSKCHHHMSCGSRMRHRAGQIFPLAKKPAAAISSALVVIILNRGMNDRRHVLLGRLTICTYFVLSSAREVLSVLLLASVVGTVKEKGVTHGRRSIQKMSNKNEINLMRLPCWRDEEAAGITYIMSTIARPIHKDTKYLKFGPSRPVVFFNVRLHNIEA